MFQSVLFPFWVKVESVNMLVIANAINGMLMVSKYLVAAFGNDDQTKIFLEVSSIH